MAIPTDAAARALPGWAEPERITRAEGLTRVAQAEELGCELLGALLKAAGAAMYAGKQKGKGRLDRVLAQAE